MSDSISRYLQIPYKYNGRTFDGCDCYGLLALWFKTELGFDLFDFKASAASSKELFKTDPNHMLDRAHLDFIEIREAELRRHDVALFQMPDRQHCGVFIDNARFLHTVNPEGASIMPLKSWRRYAVGFYRLRGADDN